MRDRSGSVGPLDRAWATLLAAAVTALAVLLLPVGAAQGHAELVSSSPKDGQRLATAPAEIRFTFGEDLLDTGNGITVTVVATGERLDLGEVAVDRDTVAVAWPQRSPAGELRAAYRVVSADGHPIDGSVTFVVASPAGPTPAAAPVSGSAAPPASPSPVRSAPTPPGAESQPEAGVLAWVLGLGVVGLVAALAATWVTRRQRAGS